MQIRLRVHTQGVNYGWRTRGGERTKGREITGDTAAQRAATHSIFDLFIM